jgi:hypothetical protein
MRIKLLLLAAMIFSISNLFAGDDDDPCDSSGTDCNGGAERCDGFDNRNYGCNCTSEANVLVGTGYIIARTSYPLMAECQSTDGGIWKTYDGPCYPSQPAAEPTYAKGKPDNFGSCWNLWCSDSGKYFVGSIKADGTRDNEGLRFDEQAGGCQSCPAAEEIFYDYTDSNQIELYVRKKQVGNYTNPTAASAATPTTEPAAQ